MTMTNSRRRFAVAASILALAFSASTASAVITVTNAKVEAGRLKVSGTSSSGTSVKLDNTFSAPRVAGAFSFNLVYLPSDCIVDLTVVGATASSVKAVIADCGPRGLNPKGAWTSLARYFENDVVTSQGSSWRAKRNAAVNLNKLPSANATFWEQLAARGLRGLRGIQGIAGLNGATGPQGPQGLQGIQGLQGNIGPQGPAGPTGATGASGPQGPSGIVNVATVAGQSPPPVPVTTFLALPVTLPVAAGQKVFVTSDQAFKAQSNPAYALDLFICYQVAVDGAPLITVGNGVAGLGLPAYLRQTFGLNASIAGLAPGVYKFGLCGSTIADPGIWEGGQFGYTTAFVFN